MSQADSPTSQFDANGPAWSVSRRDLTGRVLGDFRIERLLGHGGMGEVYLGHQISLDRAVALKVLKPELLANPTYLARFEKEALSAAKLNHPNIVHIYSFGNFEDLKYIAMEYVQGTNLKDYLAKKGIPELPLALSIMRQAGQAVAAAGEVGLVHRDIKPENLLITRKGQVKVADFGLCRASAASQPGGVELTQEGVTMGTPMYMSPEQVQGKELDHRSDLYSMGVTFYHMLAGVPPFNADSPLALALKHVKDTPVSLAVQRPDLPPELVRLVMKLMAKDQRDRYQTSVAMLRDLSRIKESIQAPTQVSAGVSTPVTDSASLAALPSGPATSTVRNAVDWSQVRRGLSGVHIGRRTVSALAFGAIVLGVLLGLRDRPRNLLAASAATPAGPPGLWMADWEAVPPQPTAEAQYRYAQLRSPDLERPAAWLAVPGRFPRQAEWTARAYTQLARSLYRRGDIERLDALSSELRRDVGRPGPRGGGAEAVAPTAARYTDSDLPAAVQAGVAALRADPKGVIEALKDQRFEYVDPAIDELSLEAVFRARRDAGGSNSQARTLEKIAGELADTLQIGPMFRTGPIESFLGP